MKTLLGRIIVGMVPGMVASIIAIVVTWNYLDNKGAERQQHEAGTPCEMRPCFAKMSGRINALETKITERTDDRYRAKDADREHKLIVGYVDKGDKALREEIAKLRLEVNSRIDGLHKK